MKKLCGVVVTAVVVLGGTALPAAAAPTAPQPAHRPDGWICKFLPIRCY